MNINTEVAQIFQRSGVNIARNVGAECFRYLQQTAVSRFLSGSVWGAQLGYHWRNILQRPWGVGTISFVLELDRRFINPQYLNRVLQEVQGWFTQGGKTVELMKVENALIAGNAPGNSIVEGTIAEDGGDPRFCKAPIQNSPFTFVGGNVDTLLKDIIRC